MPERKTVMMSSTACDLPKHRKEAMDACLRQGMFPTMMEHLPASAFHYISDIPAAPEAYIAHPYTLLQTHRLVGRQAELNLLTDWVIGKTLGVSETPRVSIFNIVAIGGMGKSALTWKWFNENAPQEMQPLAGRMWWSFYESDATFENFVIRALAYVTGNGREGLDRSPGLERSELRRSLTEHFNRDELRSLCFDLGIEHEDLPDTLNGMARELVKACERRGRIPKLIEAVRRLRPDAASTASDALSQHLYDIQQIPQAEREARLLAALDRAPFLLVLDGLERILIAYARMNVARLKR